MLNKIFNKRGLILNKIFCSRYGTWGYDRFVKLGIPGPKPWPFLGNTPEMLKVVSARVTESKIVHKFHLETVAFKIV